MGEEEEEEAAEQAGRRAHDGVLARARAQRRRREVQRTILYTRPVTPRAGRPVTVFYNPDTTVLKGRPEVWLRGSWNRRARPPASIPSIPMCAPAPAASVPTHRVLNELAPASRTGSRRSRVPLLSHHSCQPLQPASGAAAAPRSCLLLGPAAALDRDCWGEVQQGAGGREGRMWCTWCRWSHPECYMPRRMAAADPSGNLGFLTAAVDVRRLPPPPPTIMCVAVCSDTSERANPGKWTPWYIIYGLYSEAASNHCQGESPLPLHQLLESTSGFIIQ